MTSTPRILILRHPDDEFEDTSYVIHVLIEQWRQRGIPVEVTCRLDHAIDPGLIVIPHIDLTRTPSKYEAFLARCPMVLNRSVNDISKRKISRNLVAGPADQDGPVMVKTDQNAGGEPETDKLRQKRIRGRVFFAVARRLPWTFTGMLGPLGYRVYDHPRSVPKAVWRNPRLVVEKFLPERRGDLYCLRQYTFFGSREINTLVLAADPIVKAQNVTQREVLSETPPGVRELRKALGFDFGKFDYVIHENRIVLFDANRTPTYNPASRAGSPSKIILDLALGIDDFLGET